VSVSKRYVTFCGAAMNVRSTVNINFYARSSEEKVYRLEKDLYTTLPLDNKGCGGTADIS